MTAPRSGAGTAPDCDPRPELIRAYDRHAAERDAHRIAPWKVREREAFLEALRAQGARTLLEVGSGPGHYGLYFLQNGLSVTCVDLSPEMVRLCREKGLDAHVMDALDLSFAEGAFDAAWVFNCLLHVPRAQMPQALGSLARVVAPGGLVYLGQYGGSSFEGIWESDHYEPKRFFSFLSDEDLRDLVEPWFEVHAFKRESHGPPSEYGFQALLLASRSEPGTLP
jgi:SAM-dependent methyltransferase